MSNNEVDVLMYLINELVCKRHSVINRIEVNKFIPFYLYLDLKVYLISRDISKVELDDIYDELRLCKTLLGMFCIVAVNDIVYE